LFWILAFVCAILFLWIYDVAFGATVERFPIFSVGWVEVMLRRRGMRVDDLYMTVQRDEANE
jgi:hypothetical protein